MSMTETFATPDDFGDPRASELHTSLGESLSAQAGESFMSGFNTIGRTAEYLAAEHGPNAMLAGFASQQPWLHPDAPDVPIADAQARVKQEGLDGQIKLPDQATIRAPVLDLMINDAHERQQYAAAVNRGPQGFVPGALGMATQIGAGMIDPLNVAAFSIPVLGEARYGQILARAGESMFGRAAVRGAVGAAQGAVGGAALAPADWWLHTLDGQDYTMADALRSVVLSAGMGGVAHGLHGGAADLYSRITGRPLEGAPPIAGTHLPEDFLAPGGVEADLGEVPGIGAPVHPAEVLADLPPAAREDVTRSAIADVIAGEPVRAGETLDEAAKDDPRIAETVDAWHGSPYNFEDFDLSRVGSGEGAQVYGHGLYFAENEDVAASYRDNVDRDVGYEDEAGEALHYLDAAKGDKAAAAELYTKVARERGEEPDARVLEYLKAGNLYRVRIEANREHFLDHDEPLSEQTPHVRSAVEKLQAEFRERDPDTSFGTAEPVETGATLYERLASEIHPPRPFKIEDWKAEQTRRGPGQFDNEWRVTDPDGGIFVVKGERDRDAAIRTAYVMGWGSLRRDAPAASRLLAERGIPGIKYLDQGSRASDSDLEASIAQLKRERTSAEGAGALDRAIGLQRSIEELEARLGAQRTRNYVVFDDKLIRITHKNGKEVGLDELKAAAPANDAGETALPAGEGAPGAGEKMPGARPGADWARLAERHDPDPDLTEASKAADKVPDVASTEPARAVSAAQAAAGEADKLLADILPKLSDDERETFESLLKDLKNDEEARAQIVRDGAACLAEAAA